MLISNVVAQVPVRTSSLSLAFLLHPSRKPLGGSDRGSGVIKP